MRRDTLSSLRLVHHKIYGFDTILFGMVGSHNDINMLQRSQVLSRLMQGNAPVFHYEINGRAYNKCYYLADDIYLSTLCEDKP
jgi:hypothetical protein